MDLACSRQCGTLFLSPHQRTPLRVAARRGNIDKVRCLVENGADVNIKDEDGVSGLDCLCMYRCVVIGTSKTIILSLHQATPLHVAAESGNVDTVSYLGDKGADINIKDGDGVSECDYTADTILISLSW